MVRHDNRILFASYAVNVYDEEIDGLHRRARMRKGVRMKMEKKNSYDVKNTRYVHTYDRLLCLCACVTQRAKHMVASLIYRMMQVFQNS